MKPLQALPLLTGLLPKTISFHQATLDSQINSSSSPPTLSWQLLTDRVFIKKYRVNNFGVKVSDSSCTNKQSSEEYDSLLGYFYQHYSQKPLSWWKHLPAKRTEQWTTSQEVLYIFRDGGKKTDASWLLAAVYVHAEKMRSRFITFIKSFSFLEQRLCSFVIPQWQY